MRSNLDTATDENKEATDICIHSSRGGRTDEIYTLSESAKANLQSARSEKAIAESYLLLAKELLNEFLSEDQSP